jgi:hypothetical protein
VSRDLYFTAEAMLRGGDKIGEIAASTITQKTLASISSRNKRVVSSRVESGYFMLITDNRTPVRQALPQCNANIAVTFARDSGFLRFELAIQQAGE